MKSESSYHGWHTGKCNIKSQKMKILCCLMLIVLMIGLFVVHCLLWDYTTVITDVSQYGHYDGTAVDDFVTDYINSFFPDKIEDYFSDVNYVYKALSHDTYAFEAYLEFTIEDPELFHRFVRDVAPENGWDTFAFDENYQIYLLENGLDISTEDVVDTETGLYYPIERARIRAVLYSEETQTVIFWAFGVYDGGGVRTDYLNTFFDRFEIDPVVYEQTADSPHGKSPYGLDSIPKS